MTVSDREPNDWGAGGKYVHALVADGVDWTFDAHGDVIVSAMDVQRLVEPAAYLEFASGNAGLSRHGTTAGAASDGN